MKLRKLFILGLGSAAALVGLAACTKKPTADQLEAVEKALKQTVLTESGSGSPVVPGTPTDLEGEKNVCLTMTTSKKGQKVSSGNKVDVEISWSYDSSLEQYVRSRGEYDEAHEILKFNYQHARTDEHGDVIDPKTEFDTTEFKLKAVAKAGPATLEKEFIVNLKHNAAVYDPLTLAQLYAQNESHDGYAWQEGVKNIKKNHNQSFYYIQTSGKIEYISPDQNWGLLSDGNHVIELYHIDDCTDKDIVSVGDYVTVKAEIGQYKGNVQLTFIRFMEQMADHSAIQPMTEYGELNSKVNVKGDENYLPFYSGDANRFVSLSNVTVKSIDMSSFNRGARFTFVVTKEGQDFTIAYDYHVSAHESEVGDSIIAGMRSLANGNTATIKGTLRYVADNGDDEPFSTNGHWEITPFRSGDVAKVS